MPGQTAELCEAATAEVGAADGVRIANFLVSGNYAVSGGVAGCDALERLAKSFKVCAPPFSVPSMPTFSNANYAVMGNARPPLPKRMPTLSL